jgi:vanillate O-demethylase monooxygenase subunit
MAFLRNAWYCAGWTNELSDRPLGRTFLGEPVAMYRQTNGAAVAVGGRCPHRFAPLSMGKVVDDCIECPYHGLRFGPSGACSHNPHGDGAIPKAASVRAYTLAERDGIVWIWMGDQTLADPRRVPDMHEIAEQQGWRVIRGELKVKAHYELLTDNLMDLSHVPFLHPFLSNAEALPADYHEVRSLKQEGETVYSLHTAKNLPMTPLFAMLWDGETPAQGDLRANMRWEAPANLLLDVGMVPPGAPGAAGPSLPIAHLLTPETEHSTHYFWALARDRKVDDAQMDGILHAGISDVFKNEDERMIVECAHMMDTNDLFSLNPVLLQGDGPSIRARRLLRTRIDKERAACEAIR